MPSESFVCEHSLSIVVFTAPATVAEDAYFFFLQLQAQVKFKLGMDHGAVFVTISGYFAHVGISLVEER